jgi:hypothetical protein
MRRVGEVAAAIGLALLVAVGVYIGIPVRPPDPGPALPSGIVAFADASPKSSPPPSFQIPPVPSRPAASAPSTADPPAVGTAIMSVRMAKPQPTGRRGEGHVTAAHPATTVAVQPRLSTATPPPITSAAADQHPVPRGHHSHHTAADHASAGHHYAVGHHHNGVAPAASGRSSTSRHRHQATP